MAAASNNAILILQLCSEFDELHRSQNIKNIDTRELRNTEKIILKFLVSHFNENCNLVH